MQEMQEDTDSEVRHLLSTRSLNRRSCWMRFEDWFWYQNHSLFQQQTNQLTQSMQGHREAVLRIRKAMLVVMIALMIFGYYNDGLEESFTTNLMYYTHWGKYMTLITLALGCTVGQPPLPPIEEPICGRERSGIDKYNVFCSWKWYCYFYEMTFISEMTVSLFFWLLLFDIKYVDVLETAKAVQLCADHTVPFVLIMIDFCYNVIPFTWRHFIVQYCVYTSYMIFNMICTKIRGSPIYPPLDWFSERSLITFGVQAVAGVVVFWLVK